MDENRLSKLMALMPEIAKVVNQFQAVEVQTAAFETLIAAAGLQSTTKPDHTEAKTLTDEKASIPPKQPERKSRPRAGANGGRKPGRDYWSNPKIVPDLDLSPVGKPSLKQFITEKGPEGTPETLTCLVFYLKTVAGISKVSPNHLYTCYKHLGAKVPQIYDGLRNTRGRKGWLDTTDFEDVKLTRLGENFVEQDLPRRKND